MSIRYSRCTRAPGSPAHTLLLLSISALSLLAPVTALLPLPLEHSSGDASLVIVPSKSEPFFRVASNNDSKTLQAAFEKYEALSFPHPYSETQHAQRGKDVQTASRRLGGPDIDTVVSAKLTGLTVEVTDTSEIPPQLGTDESYSLTIGDGQGGIGRITAATVYGALRGLETFSQLVVFDFDTATYHLDADWGAPLHIRDAPRFPHRGLMIDTARHFLPVRTIMHALDAMSYAKLNVLHWHVSDTQSFPLEFRSRPKLWDGSHSPRERYLRAEVRMLVKYARGRGIRVVPEFDVPGHAASWCVGYPEVCPSDAGCRQPLNVARNDTFELINDIIAECAGEDAGEDNGPLFYDDFFHLGGDEVDTSCWESDPEISAWLAARGMAPDDGYAYFVKAAASIAVKHGRRPVQWSEVYDHFKRKLDPSTIVHVWKGVTNVTEVVENGFDTLVNVGYNARSWYLDNLNVAWDQMYQCDPCDGIPDDRSDLCSKVKGGHGEMWGETVDTSDLDATVWPRLAAIAERLWSPKDQTASAEAALSRIEAFRCTLNERGVAAAPVKNVNARQAPPGPGSCYEQRRRRGRRQI